MTGEGQQMRAVVVEQVGSERRMVHTRVPVPEPGEGEVLVRVGAAALDRVDTFIRRGSHGMGGLSGAVLGRDLAGTVVAVGDGVEGVAEGDRVLGCGTGSHAEYAVAPAALTVPVPDGWSFVEAAALPTAGRTAYAAAFELARVRAGDRVLVTAAGGGVGSFAVQLCRLLGAEVVATVGSAWKEERALALGATHVFRHDQEGWGARLREEAGPVDAVVETTGALAWPEALGALRDFGSVVCCGVSTGHRLDLHLGRMMTGGWRLLGIGRPDRLTVRTHLRGIVRAFDDGAVRPVVHRSLGLAEADAAHDEMERSAFFGRIVLVPEEGEA